MFKGVAQNRSRRSPRNNTEMVKLLLELKAVAWLPKFIGGAFSAASWETGKPKGVALLQICFGSVAHFVGPSFLPQKERGTTHSWQGAPKRCHV